MKKLTELQKGRIAYNYIRMNNAPNKYQFYKRFIDNEGDVEVPGFDPYSGKYESRRELHNKSIDNDLLGENIFQRKRSKKNLKNISGLNNTQSVSQANSKEKL
jgi:hypothetical protein